MNWLVLVEKKKAQLVVIANDVDPIEVRELIVEIYEFRENVQISILVIKMCLLR